MLLERILRSGTGFPSFSDFDPRSDRGETLLVQRDPLRFRNRVQRRRLALLQSLEFLLDRSERLLAFVVVHRVVNATRVAFSLRARLFLDDFRLPLARRDRFRFGEFRFHVLSRFLLDLLRSRFLRRRSRSDSSDGDFRFSIRRVVRFLVREIVQQSEKVVGSSNEMTGVRDLLLARLALSFAFDFHIVEEKFPVQLERRILLNRVPRAVSMSPDSDHEHRIVVGIPLAAPIRRRFRSGDGKGPARLVLDFVEI